MAEPELTEEQVGRALIDGMGERGVICLCGRPTKNKRYCSQECYRRFRDTPTWKDDVPIHMRRKLLRLLERSPADG